MSKPYANATTEWLEENEALLRSILLAAGHHRTNLEALSADRRGGNPHNLLDFVGIDGRDVAIALAVCERLMDSLGPTAQAMRDELDARKSVKAPAVRKSLPIVR